MGTGLTSAFIPAASWLSRRSACPHPSSGRGGGSLGLSPFGVSLQAGGNWGTAPNHQEGGELREFPTGEVLREPLPLCDVRRRPPLPLVGHIIAQGDDDRLTDSVCIDEAP